MKGFEQVIQPLTDRDKAIANLVAAGLRNHRGKVRAITGAAICAALSNKFISGLAGAKLRQIINYLRSNHIVRGICSNGNGYFVANTEEELRETIEHLEGRLQAMAEAKRALELDYKNMFNKELCIDYGTNS